MVDPVDGYRFSKPDYEDWLNADTGEADNLGASEHYNESDYISGPLRVKDGTVPMNILEL